MKKILLYSFLLCMSQQIYSMDIFGWLELLAQISAASCGMEVPEDEEGALEEYIVQKVRVKHASIAWQRRRGAVDGYEADDESSDSE